ncbi:hypothetical protein BCR36DRAFT_583027 [Piromyces finnis]|uniref:Winged helix DNA-binding domain-containing protein n=1 Tax=Piromyces finnis TaxID=1754191 RepID=A0A1Y1VCT8_9FUNG|nr:hypothetical protein BCR36DRAFT_583027 [Piromyces finnis]|eukprot:ORX51479.1 hypothetical protein BCR36DRAFT_583027 [Piromyces finnis]
MNIVNKRLLSQQLISPQFVDPVDVVEWMGALQAQDYKMMRWAVAVRTCKPSIKRFEEAYNNGEIIRVHLLRGTWHLIAGKDLHWMLKICQERVRKATFSRMKTNKVDITENEIDQYRNIMKEAFNEKHSVTKVDFLEAFSKNNVKISDRKLGYHIRLAENDGILCSGDLTSGISPTYSLVSEKVNKNKEASDISYEEALKRLTLKYFRSHSPATLEDFVWWTGFTKTEGKKCIKLMGDKLVEKVYEGQTFYVYSEGRTKGVPKSSVLLLSPFDEYLIGYKSRDIVLEPKYRHYAHNNNGIFYPVFAIDGHIKGNWKPRKKDGDFTFFSQKNKSKSSLKLAFQKFKEWGGV